MRMNLDGMSIEMDFFDSSYTIHTCVPHGRNISKRISKDMEKDSEETHDTGKHITQAHKLCLLKIMAYHE